MRIAGHGVGLTAGLTLLFWWMRDLELNGLHIAVLRYVLGDSE
jgi:hypothetical protein